MAETSKNKRNPRNNIKDGIYTIGGGIVLAVIEIISREFFNQTWTVKGLPLFVLAGIIGGIGVIMLIVGLIQKKKAQTHQPM
ncbi:MAG TPA: hypothetical protein DHW82_02765 [Spirochaetia bacterium]|nr:MAG: hypothetical protein A2Y41_03730 [Spirochaetes bacterium GWB1_36_13]HCL55913.1 hypothetical protein [Spirochaetia bacterium]